MAPADSPRRYPAIMVAPASAFANLDQALLGPGLGDIAVVRIRDITRRGRQRSKCLYWHKINNVSQVSYLENGAINPAPRWVISYRFRRLCCPCPDWAKRSGEYNKAKPPCNSFLQKFRSPAAPLRRRCK